MNRYHLIGPALLAALTSVPPLPVSAQQDRVAGCYDLYLGEWRPPAPNADSTYFALPARVRLSTDPGQGIFGQRHEFTVEVVPGAMPSMHRYSWWRLIGDDRIEIVWSTGFTGVEAELSRVSADTLRGEGVTFTDVYPSTNHRATLTAVRVRCDAVIPAERRVSHRYPRSVPLAGGDSIRLGDLFRQDANLDSVAPNRFRLQSQLAPPFQGAEQVDIGVGEDGRVEWVRLQYPAAIDFGTMVARLEAELGSPTYGPDDRTRTASWGSRTVIIGVHQDRDDSTGASVSVRIP